MTYYNTLCNVVGGIANRKGHNVRCTAATNGGRNLIFQSTAEYVLQAIKKRRIRSCYSSGYCGKFLCRQITKRSRADYSNNKAVKGKSVDASVFTKANGNMAVGCKAYASNEKQAAINATDGNNNTRRETEFADPQWLYSDLGSKKEFDTVGFIWEGAYVFADSKKNYGKWSRKKKIKIKK